jgi:hypothetical protein
MPGTSITSHGGNDKAWVWAALDFADETQKLETFAIRLGTVESALPTGLFLLHCLDALARRACVRSSYNSVDHHRSCMHACTHTSVNMQRTAKH